MPGIATADAKIRELELRHHTLDKELRLLSRHAHLTPEEQMRAQRLKQEKLSAKDRLTKLRQR